VCWLVELAEVAGVELVEGTPTDSQAERVYSRERAGELRVLQQHTCLLLEGKLRVVGMDLDTTMACRLRTEAQQLVPADIWAPTLLWPSPMQDAVLRWTHLNGP
jgi:hypothetical protein